MEMEDLAGEADVRDCGELLEVQDVDGGVGA